MFPFHKLYNTVYNLKYTNKILTNNNIQFSGEFQGCTFALAKQQKTMASSARIPMVIPNTECQGARPGLSLVTSPTIGGMRTPGSVATVLVTAISVPEKLGARSLWLENTP